MTEAANSGATEGTIAMQTPVLSETTGTVAWAVASTSGVADRQVPEDREAIVLRTLSFPHSFDAHDLIFMEGDPSTHIYRIQSGAVMLYKLLPDGRRQVVELLVAGDMFGLTLATEHDCSAETLVSTRVDVLPASAVDDNPQVQRAILHQTRLQMQTLHDHTVLLGRKSAMERVASFIERLAIATDDDALHLPMTRQEIADFLGLTIETVSRSFSELRRRGLIVCQRQDRVRVPDIDKLNAMTGAV
ncbi:MAG: helix-turn-helix domain-containing protein [Pseudomonadota bacterium]